MSRTHAPLKLTEEERTMWQGRVKNGVGKARVIRRAYTLLMADQRQQDQQIAAALSVDVNTVAATRRRYQQGGLPQALYDNPRPGGRRKLDGKAEATLVALACSDAPEGRKTWTMQLLADRLVELQVVDRWIACRTRRCACI